MFTRHLAALTVVVIFLGNPASAARAPFFDDDFENEWPVIPETTQPSSERQTAVPLGSSNAAQGYYEYLPPGYGTGGRYPLLIFIHGLGENGDGVTDLPIILNNGPPRLIQADEWDSDRPFVVLSPQHSGLGCTSSSEIDAFINFALETYDIDSDRVYLTGLSCGAIGIWNYAGNWINTQVAAIVPIAGIGIGAFNSAGCTLGDLPIWAFHGDADGTVPVSGTTGPINSLNACDPRPLDARMTIYPGVNHNSWRRTYDLSAGHDIYRWLLRYELPL